MNILKTAIGNQSTPKKKNTSTQHESLLRGVNRSKSTNLWTMEKDNYEDINQDSLQQDQCLAALNQKLLLSHQKYGIEVTDFTFEMIMTDCQKDISWSKGQLSTLLCLSDKLGSLLELHPQGEFKTYLLKFLSHALSKIENLRAQEKKQQLNHFNQLATLNFTKKNKYRKSHIEQATINRRSKNKINNDKSNTSNNKSKSRDKGLKDRGPSQDKLNRLFSKEKKGGLEDRDRSANKLANRYRDVTFSAALNSSVGVRMRRSKPIIAKTPSEQMQAQGADQTDKDQKAFIFFRPKKHKHK